MKTRWLILTLAVLLIPSTALAGWIFTDKDVDDDTGKPEKTFIQGGKLATGQDESSIQTVFDSRKNLLTILNHTNKTYWQGTPQEVKDGMSSAMDKAMTEKVKDMPPEQAAQYKAMLQAMKDEMMKKMQAPKGPRPKLEIKEAGSGGKVAGYDTVKYRIIQDGEPVAEIWLAPAVDVASEFDMSGMLKMMETMTPEPDYSTDPAVGALYKKGWPLKVAEFDQGQPDVVEHTGKVEKKDIPASVFQVPAGYQKTDLAGVNQQ